MWRKKRQTPQQNRLVPPPLQAIQLLPLLLRMKYTSPWQQSPLSPGAQAPIYLGRSLAAAGHRAAAAAPLEEGYWTGVRLKLGS